MMIVLILHNAHTALDRAIGTHLRDVHLYVSLGRERTLGGAPRDFLGCPMAPTREVLATANFDDDGLRFWSSVSGEWRHRDLFAL